jgi:hypothetical protein
MSKVLERTIRRQASRSRPGRSSAPRHRPGTPPTRSRLAGRSSPPWAPASFTTTGTDSSHSSSTPAPARSWRPTWSATRGLRRGHRGGRADGARAALRSQSGSSTTSDVSEAIRDAARAIDGRPTHASRSSRRARCGSTPNRRRSYRGGWRGAVRAGGPIVSRTPGPVRRSSALRRASCRGARVDRGRRRRAPSTGRPGLSRRSVRRSRSRSARPAEARDRAGWATSATAR